MIWDRFLATQLAKPSRLVSYLAAPLWNRRNAALNDATLVALALCPGDRVLEVGFGGGYLLGKIATVVTAGALAGADVSPGMVANCARRCRALIAAGKLRLDCAPAGSLPYPAASFTKVCTVNSIFYWTDVPRALREFSRVLVDDGLLVICFTSKASLQKRDFAKHRLTLPEPAGLQQTMESSGFRDVGTQHFSDRYRDFVCMTARRRSQ